MNEFIVNILQTSALMVVLSLFYVPLRNCLGEVGDKEKLVVISFLLINITLFIAGVITLIWI